jgi:16S rRNA (cytosine967-C5)-methyltransferase
MAKVPLLTYDIIICDAPCTGSGTWSRTPRATLFFQQPSIDSFAEKQKRIVDNAVCHLKKGGIFFYITCSVFKKENELLATYMEQQLQLELVQMNHLYGL